jgi:hypothetical protein
MKTIPILLFFIFHFSFLTPLFAQSDTTGEKKTCDGYMKSTYIFQGKIISSKRDVKMRTGKHTYVKVNSYLVQVEKVIKGDIHQGTIELIGWSDPNTYNDNGEVQRIKITDGNIGDYTPPTEGIYFSYKAKNVQDSNSTNINSKSLEFDGAILLNNGELVKQKIGITRYFSSLSDFYNYLSANYGVKIEQ